MWIYTVSGLAQTVRHTTGAIISNLHVKSLSNTQEMAAVERDLGIESRRDMFTDLDQTNEVSLMKQEQKQEFFSRQLRNLAPNLFDEENSFLFIRLLSNYYHGGEGKMNVTLWSYAITFPIENFSQDAQENNAYSFMMLTLMALSISFCLGSLVFKED